MSLVLVDSGGANLGSVRYALQRLGVEAPLVDRREDILRAERVILPGVGAAGPAMARLAELDLIDTLRTLRTPLLGVCVGMQILFETSEEGDAACLGLIPGRVRRLPEAPGVRVPHMGWNRLQPRIDSPLLDGIPAGSWAYYVHSYAAPAGEHCVAASVHGEPFAAMVVRGNVAGAQFHPERSAEVGARLLENFLRWTPA
ncbi:imidazole glycerol phosphate synthase subunit HisH [Coralloluteibacterium thermophilus]|uniref:Imidazole glycerol phosphate synthase subunit HisH n=1 Tax=Coralloluteibacterium thermophilum TaxID=2707049 RepID=A0ABV9NP78_9GAMM